MSQQTAEGGPLNRLFASPLLLRVALLGLCAAYLQGGLNKLLDYNGALAEMAHFGLPGFFAPLVIALELVASAMVVSGYGRRWAALALALFTLSATFMANRFWEMQGPERFGAANGFFEHLGLVGGFLLAAMLPSTAPAARPLQGPHA